MAQIDTVSTSLIGNANSTAQAETSFQQFYLSSTDPEIVSSPGKGSFVNETASAFGSLVSDMTSALTDQLKDVTRAAGQYDRSQVSVSTQLVESLLDSSNQQTSSLTTAENRYTLGSTQNATNLVNGVTANGFAYRLVMAEAWSDYIKKLAEAEKNYLLEKDWDSDSEAEGEPGNGNEDGDEDNSAEENREKAISEAWRDYQKKAAEHRYTYVISVANKHDLSIVSQSQKNSQFIRQQTVAANVWVQEVTGAGNAFEVNSLNASTARTSALTEASLGQLDSTVAADNAWSIASATTNANLSQQNAADASSSNFSPSNNAKADYLEAFSTFTTDNAVDTAEATTTAATAVRSFISTANTVQQQAAGAIATLTSTLVRKLSFLDNTATIKITAAAQTYATQSSGNDKAYIGTVALKEKEYLEAIADLWHAERTGANGDVNTQEAVNAAFAAYQGAVQAARKTFQKDQAADAQAYRNVLAAADAEFTKQSATAHEQYNNGTGDGYPLPNVPADGLADVIHELKSELATLNHSLQNSLLTNDHALRTETADDFAGTLEDLAGSGSSNDLLGGSGGGGTNDSSGTHSLWTALASKARLSADHLSSVSNLNLDFLLGTLDEESGERTGGTLKAQLDYQLNLFSEQQTLSETLASADADRSRRLADARVTVAQARGTFEVGVANLDPTNPDVDEPVAVFGSPYEDGPGSQADLESRRAAENPNGGQAATGYSGADGDDGNTVHDPPFVGPQTPNTAEEISSPALYIPPEYNPRLHAELIAGHENMELDLSYVSAFGDVPRKVREPSMVSVPWPGTTSSFGSRPRESVNVNSPPEDLNFTVIIDGDQLRLINTGPSQLAEEERREPHIQDPAEALETKALLWERDALHQELAKNQRKEREAASQLDRDVAQATLDALFQPNGTPTMDWKAIQEAFVNEYGDDGINFLLFMHEEGWRFEEAGWLQSGSHDWWVRSSLPWYNIIDQNVPNAEQKIYLNRRDWGGTRARTPVNVAAQIMDAIQTVEGNRRSRIDAGERYKLIGGVAFLDDVTLNISSNAIQSWEGRSFDGKRSLSGDERKAHGWSAALGFGSLVLIGTGFGGGGAGGTTMTTAGKILNTSIPGVARVGLQRSAAWAASTRIGQFVARNAVVKAGVRKVTALQAKSAQILTKIANVELKLSSKLAASKGAAGINPSPGVTVRKVGNYFIKEVDPNASTLARWHGGRSLRFQSEALTKLGDMAPPHLLRNGKLITRDAGTYTPGNFWRTYAKGSWRLGTPVNDIRPHNIGANGLIFDPALDPLVRPLYWGAGIGTITVGGYYTYEFFDGDE